MSSPPAPRSPVSPRSPSFSESSYSPSFPNSPFPRSPASPRSPSFCSSPHSLNFGEPHIKTMDCHAVKLLVKGYLNGASIDQLAKDLEEQGYFNPNYNEIVHRLIAHRIVPSTDRAVGEETKSLIDSAIKYACEDIHTNSAVYYRYASFATALDPDPAREQDFENFLKQTGLRIPPYRPDLVIKPFNRHAAIIFVTKFREGMGFVDIFEALMELKYSVPTHDEMYRLLEVNGINDDHYRWDADERRELFAGRVWGEILVPDSVFEER